MLQGKIWLSVTRIHRTYVYNNRTEMNGMHRYIIGHENRHYHTEMRQMTTRFQTTVSSSFSLTECVVY